MAAQFHRTVLAISRHRIAGVCTNMCLLCCFCPAQGGQMVIADVDLEAGTLSLNKNFVVSLCKSISGTARACVLGAPAPPWLDCMHPAFDGFFPWSYSTARSSLFAVMVAAIEAYWGFFGGGGVASYM
jgi:hypothetical protein